MVNGHGNFVIREGEPVAYVKPIEKAPFGEVYVVAQYWLLMS
jgi:hypothetical protein